MFTKETYDEIASLIREHISTQPTIGMILGSGLGELESAIADAVVLSYADIPHFPLPRIEGHRGHLVVGCLGGQQVMVTGGRVHYYEGHSMQEVTLPVRVMQAMGIRILIVTNAAGGLNPSFRPGELMLITDHINLVGMVGHNPLWGPNDPALGPRFPDMTAAYDPELRCMALEVARERDIPLRQGVYAMLAGPSFETPAEIRFLRVIGADAVGMSTAHEVVVARHAGIRVLGISGMSNVAAGTHGTDAVTHEEVLAAGAVIVPRLSALVQGVLQRIQLD